MYLAILAEQKDRFGSRAAVDGMRMAQAVGPGSGNTRTFGAYAIASYRVGATCSGASDSEILTILSVRYRVTVLPCYRAAGRPIRPFWEDIVMKSSLNFVVPSAVAILSTILPSGTAVSQNATGAATPLSTITIEAPKHVARPRQMARPAPGATGASRPAAPTPQTPPPARGSVLARIAALEKASSSCNGGCETSFKSGNAPWVGCSEAAGIFHTFSVTCRDTLTYKTYAECLDTKIFLALERNKAWWLCSSMLAGGRFAGEKIKVAERLPR